MKLFERANKHILRFSRLNIRVISQMVAIILGVTHSAEIEFVFHQHMLCIPDSMGYERV